MIPDDLTAVLLGKKKKFLEADFDLKCVEYML